MQNKQKDLKPSPGRHSASKSLTSNNSWHILHISKYKQILTILKTVHHKTEYELSYSVWTYSIPVDMSWLVKEYSVCSKEQNQHGNLIHPVVFKVVELAGLYKPITVFVLPSSLNLLCPCFVTQSKKLSWSIKWGYTLVFNMSKGKTPEYYLYVCPTLWKRMKFKYVMITMTFCTISYFSHCRMMVNSIDGHCTATVRCISSLRPWTHFSHFSTPLVGFPFRLLAVLIK